MRMFLLGVGCWLLWAAAVHGQARTLPSEKYRPMVQALEAWIAREVKDKELPALSLALVDDQTVVWAQGFGYADPVLRKMADADTVYRVGSVSKPFTTLLLMLFVEMGLIDLDVPVHRYLPDFQPKNPYTRGLTLRQMVSHRSGLVRESPVGNYFDGSGPTLAQTVASLNQTELIYEPETTLSYSNAALAVVGRMLEVMYKEDFAKLMQKKLLEPMDLRDSTFALTPELQRRLAKAMMWTYHGRTFPAPTFELGTIPAGCLYSTANDQAKLLQCLFAGGKSSRAKVLKKETLDKMWQLQYSKPGEKAGFGLGFAVAEFEGRRRIGHGGAIYGFATELAALPDDKLGVIVMASRDVANAVTRRVAETSLRHLLAVRQGKPLPIIEETRPLTMEEARELAGRYEGKKGWLDLEEAHGKLRVFANKGGFQVALRKRGKDLITDDVLGYGQVYKLDGPDLMFEGEVFRRTETPNRPPAPPAKWHGLIGEYGPDHNSLTILERDAKLHALIEWVFLYPLEEVNKDTFRFPDHGLFRGDKVVFQRDATGWATGVTAANIPMQRRPILGEKGETFTVTPPRPVADLLKDARAARPPEEKNALLKKPELVDVAGLDPTIKLDIRYAGSNNFLRTPVYPSARALLQKPAAEAVARAQKKLVKHNLGLLIHDAYRPWHVTKVFYDATPTKYRLFVADPALGSRHNRGCAVDLTLYDLRTGDPIDMVSGYDEFHDRAYPGYLGGTSQQRWYRDLLRRTMENEGFTVFDAEWWHFDYRDWRQYPILNVTWDK